MIMNSPNMDENTSYIIIMKSSALGGINWTHPGAYFSVKSPHNINSYLPYLMEPSNDRKI